MKPLSAVRRALSRRLLSPLVFAAALPLAWAAVGCEEQASPIQPDPAQATAAATAQPTAQPTPTQVAVVLPTATAAEVAVIPTTTPIATAAAADPSPAAAEPAASIAGATSPAPPTQLQVKTPASAKAPAAAAAPKPSISTTIKLLKAGAEPRRELRFKFKKGHSEKMKMAMKMQVEMGAAMPKQELPQMEMSMRISVVDTKANGDAVYTFTLSGTDVKTGTSDPRVVAAMKQALGQLYGLSGTVTVSDRGENKGAKIQLPEKLDAQSKQVMQGMEQAMQQVSAPLPAEAVGKGAQWMHTTNLSQNGITLSQSATYELVDVAGDNLKLAVTIVQSAPKQSVSAGGASVTLLSLKSEGKGTTKMALNRIVPNRSKMRLTSTANMDGGGRKISVTTGMIVKITGK